MTITTDVKIIVVTGVESTGKTSLVKELAAYYDEPYVLEVARQYLEEREGRYAYDDLEEIAKRQSSNIQLAKAQASKYVFVDTAFVVMKIWSEEKYGKCAKWILDRLASFEPSAYVLCDTDVAWEQDSLREHPNEMDRVRLHQNYIAHLQEQRVPFTLISGTKKERLKKAAQFINTVE